MPIDLPEILNWRRIDDLLTTSGQPSAEQFEQIKAIGITAIINLAPADSKDALPAESKIIGELGMQYAYVPVDFEAPTDADFEQFCAAMDRFSGDQIHIHCIYNARVTAFMTRYIRDVSGGDLAAMLVTMDGIWRPGGVWASFLGDAKNSDQPNRYKGYEYD